VASQVEIPENWFRVGKEVVEPRALSYMYNVTDASAVLSTSEKAPCWSAEALSYSCSE